MNEIDLDFSFSPTRVLDTGFHLRFTAVWPSVVRCECRAGDRVGGEKALSGLFRRLFGENQLSPRDSNPVTNLEVSEQSVERIDFGPFAVLFSRGTYLRFLGMGSPDVQSALTRLSDVLQSIDDAHKYIDLMLRGRNWRPHLVACVAALLLRERAEYASMIWRTFDYGSWVAPQLAVVLYLSDPEFRHEAKRRIVNRCPVTAAPDLYQDFDRTIRVKNLASLLRVMSFIPSETHWVASELERADIRALVNADSDCSGEIAVSWLEAAQMQFTKFGRNLGPGPI